MKFHHFTQSERLEISILLFKKYSHRDIGKALGYSHTSIGREIRRNSASGKYDARQARVKLRQRRRYIQNWLRRMIPNITTRRIEQSGQVLEARRKEI